MHFVFGTRRKGITSEADKGGIEIFLLSFEEKEYLNTIKNGDTDYQNRKCLI